MSFLDKHNYKKCTNIFEIIKRQLRDSTSRSALVFLGKVNNYERLFKMITDEGWEYELLGNKKEGFYISVKSKKEELN